MAQRHLRDAVTSGTFAEILASCHAAQQCLNAVRVAPQASGPELEAKHELAEELAAWLGPVLAEVGLVAASDDERVEEMAGLLAAEAKFCAPRGLPTMAQLAAALIEISQPPEHRLHLRSGSFTQAAEALLARLAVRA